MTALGVVTAMPAEASAWCRRRCRAGATVTLEDSIVACGGIGPERARVAAERLVELGVRELLSFGIAGGLDPTLGSGDLVVPERVLVAAERFECSRRWCDVLRPERRGSILASGVLLADVAAKRAAAAATGAVAVDMESGAVAAVARDAAIPLTVVRAICDPADRALPRAVREAVDEFGRARVGAVLRGLARRPFDVVAVLGLARAMRAATRRLRRARLAMACRRSDP